MSRKKVKELGTGIQAANSRAQVLNFILTEAVDLFPKEQSNTPLCPQDDPIDNLRLGMITRALSSF